MSILKILQYPDLKLKRQAVPVSDVNEPRIQQIIADMLETLAHTEHCAGLSATQLDMPDPPRITVIAPMPNLEKTLVLVNPEVTHKEGNVVGLEGCMSVYPSNISAEIKRAEIVTLRALDRDGEQLEMIAGDFLAICIQHEIDHLNGVLYIDHLSPLKRRFLERKILKVVKNLE